MINEEEKGAPAADVPLLQRADLRGEIVQNTMANIVGRGLALVFSTLAAALLARYLGSEKLGEYGAIYAYLGLFAWMATFGFEPVIVREASRDRKSASDLVRTAMTLSVFLSVGTIVVAVLVAPWAGYGGRLRSLLILAGIEYVLTPLRLPEVIFQIDLRQWYGSTINVVRQGIWLGMIVVLWLLGRSALLRDWRARAGRLDRVDFDLGIRAEISGGEGEIPAGPRADDFFAFVSHRVYLAARDDLYADRSGDAAQDDDRFHPGTIRSGRASERAFRDASRRADVYVGSRSRGQRGRSAEIPQLHGSDISLLYGAGCRLCVLMTIGARIIVRVLYGKQFLPAAPLLAVLIWSEIAVFFATVVVNVMVARNHQNLLPIPTLAGAAINVALNLVLIPRYAAMGTAWATLVSYSLAWMVALLFFKQTRSIT